MSKRTELVDGKLDLLRDEIHGRERTYTGGMLLGGGLIPGKPAIKGILPRLEAAEKRVTQLTGIVEQLAALHGKEIVDFEPTTSKYGRVLVDAEKESDSDTTD